MADCLLHDAQEELEVLGYIEECASYLVMYEKYGKSSAMYMYRYLVLQLLTVANVSRAGSQWLLTFCRLSALIGYNSS